MTAEEIRTVAALGALALLLSVTLAALVMIVRALRDTAGSMQRLHLQQATIVRMLLRAGFRPPSSSPDWCDDAHKTRGLDELWYTKYDMKAPQ